jgi:DNA polymerase V
MKIPLLLNNVKAGFPSPADDFVENYLDLNDYLIKHPVSTFFVRVSGDSMQDMGIAEGNILIVDRSILPFNGATVVGVVENNFTVKTYKLFNNEAYLVPQNRNYQKIKLKGDDHIWGVVTCVINKLP